MNSSRKDVYVKCALPQCSGLRFNLFHKFPVKPERCKLWLEALDDPVLNATTHLKLQNVFLCSRHFRVEDYQNPMSRKLNSVANPVPSLNLKTLNELDKCRHGDTKQEPGKKLFSSAQETNNNATHPESVTKQIYSSEHSQSQEDLDSSSVECEGTQLLTDCFEDNSKLLQIVVVDRFIQITDTLLDNKVDVDISWLRYKCNCKQCFDEQEARSLINFFEVDNNMLPTMAWTTEESRNLHVLWNDGHISSYYLQHLYENIEQVQQASQINTSILRNFQNFQGDTRYYLQPFSWSCLLQSNNTAVYKALDRLQKFGVLVINQIPKCGRDSLLNKTIITKLFDMSWHRLTTEKRKGFFQHKTNTPFSNLTYESMDKGIQILTVPKEKDHLNLQVNFVDGFQAIAQLSKEALEFFTQYKVAYSYTNDSGFKHIVKHPVILKDQKVDRIWFSTSNVENISSKEFQTISKHFRELNNIIQTKQKLYSLELNTETIIILDNYRILWCLKEPHIDSELDCIYLERKDYLSSLYSLSRNSMS